MEVKDRIRYAFADSGRAAESIERAARDDEIAKSHRDDAEARRVRLEEQHEELNQGPVHLVMAWGLVIGVLVIVLIDSVLLAPLAVFALNSLFPNSREIVEVARFIFAVCVVILELLLASFVVRATMDSRRSETAPGFWFALRILPVLAVGAAVWATVQAYTSYQEELDVMFLAAIGLLTFLSHSLVVFGGARFIEGFGLVIAAYRHSAAGGEVNAADRDIAEAELKFISGWRNYWTIRARIQTATSEASGQAIVGTPPIVFSARVYDLAKLLGLTEPESNGTKSVGRKSVGSTTAHPPATPSSDGVSPLGSTSR